MPTYAYRCADCAHAFDIYQEFQDDALTVCPECGGRLRKVFGSLGVTFKGAGFYRTDSRSGSSSGGGSEKTSGSDGGGSTQASKTSE
ncbi:FmdB family transcriptional regulator [Leucobacter weissii]|uniref:FmdB family transcriptional regulator n=1 Tax=Leucobacter weissii TaxID=1983706 RepID=A0A939S4X9_9MICO|nr:FmdB family transcriptional regulator [Leucobacter weissii]